MTKRFYMVVYMMALAACFGGAVTALQLLARDTIERNRHLKQQRQLLELFELGDPDTLSTEECARIVEQQIGEEARVSHPEAKHEIGVMKVYADAEQSDLKAYGIRFRGLGFWAPIEGILAVNPEATMTLGLIVLEHQETPGLGGRIEERDFRKQFDLELAISPTGSTPDGTYLAMAGADVEPEPGDRRFAAITGATQTSMAMERILNNALDTFHRGRDEGGSTVD